jgi:hypothetical protein
MDMDKNEINRIFDEMIDSIPKIKISTFISIFRDNRE